MWYFQYMRALDAMSEAVHDAEHERLAAEARRASNQDGRVNLGRRLAARVAVALGVGAIQLAEALDCRSVSDRRVVRT